MPTYYFGGHDDNEGRDRCPVCTAVLESWRETCAGFCSDCLDGKHLHPHLNEKAARVLKVRDAGGDYTRVLDGH